MRLIDAEVVKEFLRENLILPDEIHEKIVETMIDAIPTAYDIDKVVEELEIDSSVKPYESGNFLIPVGRAIEIVKHGCVSDDVCEWIKYDYRTMCPKNHDVKNLYWRIPMDMDKLKYCPYCGKKIKVVDK